MSDDRQQETRQIPAWLLGLIIAAVLFTMGFFIFSALGYGDDPVIEQSVFPLFVLQVARHRRVNG